MEDPRFLKRKLIAVSKAAVLGAAVAEALIALDWLAYGMSQRGYLNNFWRRVFVRIDLIQSLPSILVTEALGRDINSGNPYLVNGVLGFVLFGAVAAFWQFLVKRYEKQSPDSP